MQYSTSITVNNSTFILLESKNDSSLRAMPTRTCNWKTLGFAILIIAGLGCLAITGVGLGAFGVHQIWWVEGTLSQLSQITAILMMTVGGAGGMTLFLIGMVGALKKREQNNDQNKSIVRFGKEQWGNYFGNIGEEPPLPHDIDDILNAACPFSNNPNIKVKDTHMLVLIPEKIDEEPLTLDKIGELVKTPKKGGYATCYAGYSATVKNEFGTKHGEKSHWVLMTRDVIPDSRNKSYKAQQAKADEYPGYQLVSTRAAVICFFVGLVKWGIHLYGADTYTRTEAQTQEGKPVLVGGFTSAGLFVDYSCVDDDCYGIGLMRKFKAIET